MAAGDYAGAGKVFNGIRGYEDVDSIIANDENIAAATYVAQFEVGNTVTFGTYGGEPIEWLVLEANGDERIMISAKGLDAVCFNKSRDAGNKWESSYVRTWLNETFYNKAFSSSEQERLTAGVTGDRVYLLSEEEAERYFANDRVRKCYATQYAVKNGANARSSGACWWWLRSPGLSSSSAACVADGGSDRAYGRSVDSADVCVRPVVALRLV